MNAPGSPRFRFRTPGGDEVPVASVTDLSNRVSEGELGPETPLFDAGTGQWDRAGDVPVFQFVVEELRAEGRLPEGWDEVEVVVLPDPPPEEVIDPGREFEPIRHEGGEGAPGDARPRESSAGDDPRGERPTDDLPDGDEGRASGEQAPGVLDVGALPEGSDLSLASEEERGDGHSPMNPMGPTPDPFELHLPLSGRGGGAEAPAEPEEEPREPWFEDRYGDAPGEAAEGGEEDAPPPGEDGTEGGEEGGEPGAGPRGAGLDGDEEGRGDAEAVPDPEADAAPVEELDSSPLHTWLTHGPPPPGTRQGGARDGGDRGSQQLELEPTAPPTRPPAAEEGTAAGSGPAEGPPPRPLDIRTAWEDEASLHDPRALHLATRRRRRNARVMAGAAVLLVVAVGGAALHSLLRPSGTEARNGVSVTGVPGEAGVTGDRAAPGETPLDQAPAGLEEEASILWAALPAEVARVVDSLRVAAELPEAPPREWLGGFYLANAGQFPGVVEFWDRYRDFVRNLGERDEALVEGAARAVLDRPPLADRELGPADRDALLGFVRSRQGGAGVTRRDRYTHLERTALASLQLHDFLVENGGAITYTPALGRGVSADPVLEAVTDSPQVQRQLERHLDRVFEALDRTRGGGPPSLAGLRAELFGSLGRPL